MKICLLPPQEASGDIAPPDPDGKILRALSNPIHRTGGLSILHGSLAPDAEVLTPNGNPLCEWSTGQEQSCRLTVDGAYTVLISDVTGTNTGNYTVYIQRLDGPLGCRAVNLGDAPLVRSITLLGAEDCFTFPGTTKQRVKVVVLRTAGTIVPNTEVIRPQGVDACPPTTETTNFHCLLAGAGTYMLLIRDLTGTNTGSYSVAVSGL